MKSADSYHAVFPTTLWTEVLAAAHGGAAGDSEALARLYIAYWHPLYAYIRRRGYAPSEAEDIAQDFFTRLIEKKTFSRLQREGGRFRSFLLQSMNHFLANEWDSRHAQKRGGGLKLIPLDAEEGETRFASLQLPDAVTPEGVFEKQWALTLLDQVMDRLRREQAALNKTGLFEALRPHLQGDRSGLGYAEIALQHGTSEGALKVAVHRLRQRYGLILRDEIGRTVGGPAEVDEELRHLLQVVGG